MKRRLAVRPLAKGDLDEQARYIARDDVEAALRFLDAAEGAFDRLRSLPEIGKARKFQHPKLAHIRSWPVPGFEKHVIFYRASPEGWKFCVSFTPPVISRESSALKTKSWSTALNTLRVAGVFEDDAQAPQERQSRGFRSPDLEGFGKKIPRPGP